MKMYEKKDLRYEGGYLFNADGDAVFPDPYVVQELNQIDTDIQMTGYERSLPKLSIEEAKPFVRASEHSVHCDIDVATPALDKKVEEAIALMGDLDMLEQKAKAQEYVDGIEKALKWVADDKFIGYSDDALEYQFDLPTLGNPLELTFKSLVAAIIGMFDSSDELNINYNG